MKVYKRFADVLPSVISVMIGLFTGWFLMMVANPMDSIAGIVTILKGGFSDGFTGMGQVIYTATPIIMTGLSVGFAFQTGLFNIGASGQFTIGAFTAILIGVKLEGLPSFLHCFIAITAGMAAGAIFGAFSGILKSKFKVSEVISGIMLNYIAMLFVNMMIKNLIYDSSYNRSASVAYSAVLRRGFLENIIPGSGINIGFLLVIVSIVIIKMLLDKTVLGYELKIIGKNSYAGMYAGIDDKKSIVLSMMISGALSALGGTLMYLSDFGDHIMVVDNVLQQGFTGISVALLGMSDPIGIFVSGLFIAHLTVGGNYLQLYSYTPEVVEMIVGVIIYCSALTLIIKKWIDGFIKKKIIPLKSETEDKI